MIARLSRWARIVYCWIHGHRPELHPMALRLYRIHCVRCDEVRIYDGRDDDAPTTQTLLDLTITRQSSNVVLITRHK